MSKGMCGIVLAGVIGLFSLIGVLSNGFLENRHKKWILYLVLYFLF